MTKSKPSLFRRAAPAIVLGAVAIGVVSRFDTGATALVSSKSQTPNGSSGNSSSSSNSSSPGATGAACGKQVVGDTASIVESGGPRGGNFGTIAVTAWVDNGKVCKVSTNYQAYDGRSDMIDQQVVPILDQAAVQAGSANISMISGATYTSQAYAQSLQSAIDKA